MNLKRNARFDYLRTIKMKFLLVFVLLLFFNNSGYSQNIAMKNLTGAYFADKDNKILISLCEKNEWYYTNNCVPDVDPYHIFSYGTKSLEQIGYSSLNDSIISLRDWNDILFFELKVIDTLNLQVVFAKETFAKGDYLNRTMDFFPGSFCGNYLANLHLTKWEISDHNLYRFDTIGYWVKAKHTVQRLTYRYWLRK